MKAKGFTLIELAIVIVIIGILVAIAVPRFVDLTGEANTAAKEASYAAVRSAYAIAIAEKKGYPTAAELLAKLEGATRSGNKIKVTIGGTATDIAELYKDTGCTSDQAVTADTDQVKCVKKGF